MKQAFFFVIIFFLAILEATDISIPLILDFLFLYYVFTRKSNVFGWGLLGGIILDILFLKTIGTASIFLIIFLFTIFLYERKFEIQTIPFVFLATFVGGLLYMNIMGYYNSIQYTIINSLFAVFCFMIYKKIRNPNIEIRNEF